MRAVEFIKSKRVLLGVCLAYVIQMLVGALLIYYVSIAQTKSFLDGINQRVQAGIQFNGDEWDISKYNADPEIPGSYRLYVFASDGYVVDRWRPIDGYLNVSNFRHLLEYQAPQTIETITDQRWRMYSRPIIDNGREVGVITTSYYRPDRSEATLERIDDRLERTLDAIEGKLTISDGEIDTSAVDSRDIPFYTPYQVVNQYNRILAKSNNANSMDRIPDYIDSTYVLRNLQRSSAARQVQDDTTGEVFLTVSHPLVDSDGAQRGVVIAGRSISHVHHLLNRYLIVNAILAAALVAAFGVAHFGGRKRRGTILAARVTNQSPERLALEDIRNIAFHKKESVLFINNHKIPLTYATNQYYLCAALFSARKKKWETDELIERFGERHDHTSWRKIYDASVSVNKKAAILMEPKLIINNNKTYQINHKLQEKID